MKKTFTFWFTGLSGSGKTTIANSVKPRLEKSGYSVFVIDGDEVRKRHHSHLSFTQEDIKENNFLIAKMCIENKGKYDVILVPIISPYNISRQKARDVLNPYFYEIYFSAPLSCVIARDVKGLYTKARRNEIDRLIGYSPSNVYEPPQYPDFIVNSDRDSIDKSSEEFYQFVISKIGGSNS